MTDEKKPRRAKGEGSIGVRKDGLHYSVLTLADGRRRWLVATRPTTGSRRKSWRIGFGSKAFAAIGRPRHRDG